VEDPDSTSLVLSLAVMVLLLLFSAMISGSEVAFFSLNPSQLKDVEESQSRRSKLILALMGKPKRLLATILISNNFINVAIVVLSVFITNGLIYQIQYPLIAFLIQIVVVTALILLFGEIIPKMYAATRAVKFATIMVMPLNALVKFFSPLSLILVRSTSFIDKQMAGKGVDISISDLSEAIEITSDETTPEDEKKILKGIVKFGDIEVSEIMKSRVDVIAVEMNEGFDEIMEKILTSGFSRIPVYEESFDQIKGILYVKDLLPYLDEKEGFKWNTLIRDAFFVPENKKISDLLKEFQEKKIHMAIIVDEYGGTSGLVTLEDIIEEIVGDISDEFDSHDEEIDYTRINDNNFIFEGKTTINDFCKIIGIEDEIFDEVKGDSDSLAGLILELEGKIPEKDITINFQNFDFTIKEVDDRRIQRIHVSIKPEEENA